jgi:hypothetical protein
MNENNLEFLKNTLKYHGFGEQLYPELEKNISQRFPEFVLRLDTEINRDQMSASLYFKRGEGTDMYFLNRWDATLKNETGKLEQPFYFNKGQAITLKEGYNLLNGRAVNTDLVNKEGQKYNAWVQLDFSEKDVSGSFKVKQFHENYGYNLEKALEKFPIKELNDLQQKERLMISLGRGNLAPVTFERDNMVSKMFVEANPQYKSVTVYDGSMVRLGKEEAEKFSVKEAPEKKESIEQKVDKKNELKAKPPLKNSGDVSLLSKKRVSDHKTNLGRA